MEPERAQRIEEKLELVLRELVPRHEFDRREARLEARFDRIDSKLDQALATSSQHDTRIGIVETKLDDVDELNRRVLAVEDVAAVHRKKDDVKSWKWPTITTIGATVLNAMLTGVAFLVSPHQ
jgi:hypothetical protein